MEMYHAPYTPNHRYWTGLLLLIRVVLYLVSAFNPSGDPRVTISATNFIMTGLLLYIATFSIRMYKNRFINAMEMITYFNIIVLSIFTCTIDADTNQAIITNISISVTFIQLTLVIVYHVYNYTSRGAFTLIQECVTYVKVTKLTSKERKQHKHKGYHQLHEILHFTDCPPNDFQVQLQSAEPTVTVSVVELPKPQLAPATPPPVETIEEKSNHESTDEQQAISSEQDGITAMNPSTAKCNYSGDEVATSNEISKIFETENVNGNSIEENCINQQCESNV